MVRNIQAFLNHAESQGFASKPIVESRLGTPTFEINLGKIKNFPQHLEKTQNAKKFTPF